MKVGLFGGTFDPIHFGHLKPVQAARRELGLEKVIYLPTAQPPHKAGREMAPAHARYTMVELALLDEEGLYASPHELTPGRKAYTVDTLEEFSTAMPDADLHLLLGGDAFLDFAQWWRYRDIARLAHLVVLVRPGWDLEKATLNPELADLAASGRVLVLHQDALDVSSTQIRQTLSRGEAPPTGTVPDLVVNYARKYQLYR
ncbi:MAG TPA: nicotinate-nucleotide adenylyltransferase [Thermoanaerobaculia bacterium]|nr:nicotinate-nucleotide adenylyltransferase [Thermoanaerobaculia bacterium]